MKRISKNFRVICALTASLLLNTPISVLNASATAGGGDESSPFELAGTAGVDVGKFSPSSAKFTFTVFNGNLIINFVESGAGIEIPNASPGTSFTFSAPIATEPPIIAKLPVVLDNAELSKFKPLTTYRDIVTCFLQGDGSLFTSRLSDGKVETLRSKLFAVTTVEPEAFTAPPGAEVVVPTNLSRPEDFYLRNFKPMDSRGTTVLRLALSTKSEDFLKQAVAYGHCDSMIALGEICQQREEFETAYKWFLLALETNWVTTKTPEVTSTAKTKLGEAFKCLPHKNGVKSKDHEKFLESFKSRANLHTIALGRKLPVMLSEEDALRRKLSIEVTQYAGEESPWGFLGGDYNAQKETAIICYERCGSTISLNLLGNIYKSQGNYEKARYYYEKSGNYYNLGLLYNKKKLSPPTGRPFGDEAIECYQKATAAYTAEGNSSSLADALINLASVVLSDDLGVITLIPIGIDSEQYARNCLEQVASIPSSEIKESSKSVLKRVQGDLCLRELGDPDRFEKAARYYSSANSPGAWFLLGSMYGSGKINPPKGKNKFQAAFECYEKSGNPQSMCNTGNLYKDGKISPPPGKNQFQAAEGCYKQSKHYNAYFNLLRLYKNHYAHLRLASLEALTKQEETTKSLCRALEQENIETRLYGAGLIEDLNENYEAALYWYHQALHVGYEGARNNYTAVQNILSAQHRRNELAVAL